MKILVNLSEGFYSHPALKPVFQRLAGLGTLVQRSHNSEEEIRPDLVGAHAIIMWSWPALTPEMLDLAPDLKFLGCLDISQTAARLALSRGLPVSVSRGGFSPAVAEMALGLILGTLRRISDYHTAMRTASERWVRQFPTQIDPIERELTGRSVGLIGFGGVGRRLAELLAPFHCDLRIVDPFVPAEVAAAHGAKRVTLHEMLAESDVVVVCAASNAGSRALIGREEIALLRDDAVLVNVARAAIVDTAALVERLQGGRLFAALDVFDREPLDSSSVLRLLPNAYLTPHRAGGVVGSACRIVEWLVDDLEAVLAGQPRAHVLTEAMIPGLDG